MSSINPNQLNAMAQEIYNLLDAKETADGVNNGKDKLGDSIWNKFVGPDENGKNQVGNGEKSKIKKEIPFQKAISSIVSYINNKGTAAIQDALKRVGIDWKPSVDVEANSSTAQEQSTNKVDAKTKAATKQKSKAKQAERDEKTKKYSEIEKQKNTIKVKVNINGEEKEMTYNEITRQLYSFKSRMSMFGVVEDPKTGKNRWPRLSELHSHLKYWAGRGDGKAKKMLGEMEGLLNAKHQLEEKHPDFKNVKYTVVEFQDQKQYWDGQVDDFIDE